MKIREREQAYSIEYGGKLTSLGWCYGCHPHTLPAALSRTGLGQIPRHQCSRTVFRELPRIWAEESFTRADATDGVASKYWHSDRSEAYEN